MQRQIPRVHSDDKIIIYAYAEGPDHRGELNRNSMFFDVRPCHIEGTEHSLMAIQTTTASMLVRCAEMLVDPARELKRIILQSDLAYEDVVLGSFVESFYYGSQAHS